MPARRCRGNRRTGVSTGVALGVVLLAGCSGAPSGTAGRSTTAAPAPTSSRTTTTAPSTASPTSAGAPSASSASSSSASSSASPRGRQITSRDATFTLTVPDRWVDISDQFKDLHEVLLAARAAKRSHGTFPNVAVSGSTARYSGTAAQAARQSAEQFRKHDAQVTRQPDLMVGGERAVGYRMLRTENATQVVQVQYFVVHDHRLYSPTGTAAPQDEQTITHTLRSVLKSWQWS